LATKTQTIFKKKKFKIFFRKKIKFFSLNI
jgi:hypothetical protein